MVVSHSLRVGGRVAAAAGTRWPVIAAEAAALGGQGAVTGAGRRGVIGGHCERKGRRRVAFDAAISGRWYSPEGRRVLAGVLCGHNVLIGGAS